jgi:hypothetical protein
MVISLKPENDEQLKVRLLDEIRKRGVHPQDREGKTLSEVIIGMLERSDSRRNVSSAQEDVTEIVDRYYSREGDIPPWISMQMVEVEPRDERYRIFAVHAAEEEKLRDALAGNTKVRQEIETWKRLTALAMEHAGCTVIQFAKEHILNSRWNVRLEHDAYRQCDTVTIQHEADATEAEPKYVFQFEGGTVGERQMGRIRQGLDSWIKSSYRQACLIELPAGVKLRIMQLVDGGMTEVDPAKIKIAVKQLAAAAPKLPVPTAEDLREIAAQSKRGMEEAFAELQEKPAPAKGTKESIVAAAESVEGVVSASVEEVAPSHAELAATVVVTVLVEKGKKLDEIGEAVGDKVHDVIPVHLDWRVDCVWGDE